MYLVRKDVEQACHAIAVFAALIMAIGMIVFCATDSDISCFTILAAFAIMVVALFIEWYSKAGL